jgi:hypothetical protein
MNLATVAASTTPVADEPQGLLSSKANRLPTGEFPPARVQPPPTKGKGKQRP